MNPNQQQHVGYLAIDLASADTGRAFFYAPVTEGHAELRKRGAGVLMAPLDDVEIHRVFEIDHYYPDLPPAPVAYRHRGPVTCDWCGHVFTVDIDPLACVEGLYTVCSSCRAGVGQSGGYGVPDRLEVDAQRILRTELRHLDRQLRRWVIFPCPYPGIVYFTNHTPYAVVVQGYCLPVEEYSSYRGVLRTTREPDPGHEFLSYPLVRLYKHLDAQEVTVIRVMEGGEEQAYTMRQELHKILNRPVTGIGPLQWGQDGAEVLLCRSLAPVGVYGVKSLHDEPLLFPMSTGYRIIQPNETVWLNVDGMRGTTVLTQWIKGGFVHPVAQTFAPLTAQLVGGRILVNEANLN